MALQAKPSPLSPRQPLLASHPPTTRRWSVRAGGTRPALPVEPSATLTLSPQRRGPPWTGVPAPGRLTFAHAQGARALQISLCPPYGLRAAARARPEGPEASARAGRGALASRWSSTDGTADQPDSGAGPAAVPSLTSSRSVRRLAPPPGSSASATPRTPSAAPPPHPCTRDHCRPRPRCRVLGTLSHGP